MRLAQGGGWDVCVLTSPSGRRFADTEGLQRLTGHPVRSEYKNPRRATYAIGFLLGGSPVFVALVVSAALPPVVLVGVLSGLAAGVLNPIIGAVLYERVPARLQARVLGASKSSAWIGIPFGSLLGGVLTEGIGLQGALLATGAAMFVMTLAPFVFPAWRGLNRPAPARRGEDRARCGGSG